jgi:hypothetical protein
VAVCLICDRLRQYCVILALRFVVRKIFDYEVCGSGKNKPTGPVEW